MSQPPRADAGPPQPRCPLLASGWRALDPYLLAVFALGAVFLLANLGGRQLWADEAETAGLARNILHFGVPKAFDGVNYISQWWQVAGREDFNENLIWVLTPWLQLYLTAGAFALLGESPLAARLPFALFGLANLWLVYRLALAVFRDRRVARLSALLLVFCIPFLLHMRQGRYYALIVFFTMAVMLAYLWLLERRRGAALLLVLSAALLFHSSYGVWLPVVAALTAHAVLFARSRISVRTAASISAGLLSLVAPFALYAEIYRRSSFLSPHYVAFNLLNYLITINNYVLPLGVVIAVAALRSAARRRPLPQPPALAWTAPGVTVMAMVVGAGLCFASLNVNYFFRYAIHLVPLLALLHAALLIELSAHLQQRWGRPAGSAALALLLPLTLFTTLTAQPVFPLLYALESRAPREPWADDPLLRRPRAGYSALVSEIFDFVYEITHDYQGPDGALAEFLKVHAGSDDLVFAQYGDVPLVVATGLAVRGGSQGVPFVGEPDWIVPRAFESPEPLRRFARERGYDEYVLDVADTRWENQPDPYSHQYRTVPVAGPGAGGYPALVVYGHPRKRLAGGGIGLGHGAGAPPLRPRRAGPPNLLLVSLDSARADRLTEAGLYFTEPTRLQRLASKGTLFTLARTAAPGTAAAAASLLTGLDAHDLAGAGPDRALPAGVPTLAQRLREAGYETAAVLGSAAVPAELGLADGFDTWIGAPEGSARQEDFEVTRQARGWLLARTSDRPWFLWVHLNAAHGPYRAAQNPFDSLSALSARVRARSAAEDGALPILADNGGHGGIPAYQALRGVRRAGAYRAIHDLMTLVGDFFLGELLDTLDVSSASNQTIVAVAGSHGESLGEDRVFFNHGEDLDESVLRVPLVLYVPGQVPAVVEDPVSGVDLVPTLLSLLGLPVPLGLRGLDLSASSRGGPVDVSARAGVTSELRPPQGPGAKLAVSGRHWRVELGADGSPVAIDLSRPDAPPLDPVGARDPELAALVAEAIATSQRPEPSPGPSLAFPPERRAALEWLGYVAGRLPGVAPDTPASGGSTR